ncbi:MAG: hypothetical protein KF901_15765 [Myxococcales bacterium]|nr:hypothetical protein [Myxococcales bacterium]
MARLLLLTVSVSVACGGTPPPVATPVEVARENDGTVVETVHEPPGLARALGPLATVQDLVRAAQRLDERGAGESDAGCLLRGGAAGGAWRLEGSVALPIRPLPAPPDALTPRLTGRGPVQLLGVWGRRGSGTLTLAVLTATTPRRGSDVVLFVTGEGAHLRRTDREVTREEAGPHAAAALAARLAAMETPARVIVTGDAALPLASLRPFLVALPASLEAAFAVALPSNVQLPAAAAPLASDAGLCLDGLPPSTEREGELPVRVLLEAIDAARPALRECLSLAPPEAAAGGRLEVSFRVAADGGVADACARADAIGDPGVRACVLQAIGAMQLSPPSPAGVVDVVVPLLLVPDPSLAQRPLCE